MRRTARGLLIALLWLLSTAGMSLPEAALSTTRQVVVYRCATPSGQVEYTSVPKVGCVVIAITRQPVDGDIAQPRGSNGRNAPMPGLIAPTRREAGIAPAGASAQCRDGTYSFSRSRRGTCSHHGGVARWL